MNRYENLKNPITHFALNAAESGILIADFEANTYGDGKTGLSERIQDTHVKSAFDLIFPERAEQAY